MIAEGFELMAIGMGTVFSFLVLLVGCMKLLGKISEPLSKIFPEDEPALPPASTTAIAPSAANASNSNERVAVALAAAHRAR